MTTPIPEVEKMILEGIHDTCYDDYAAGYDSFEDWTGLTHKDLKPILLEMRNKGLVTYEKGLMTDDGEVAGSGYMITYKGKCIIFPCDVCGEYAVYSYDGKKECEEHKSFGKK